MEKRLGHFVWFRRNRDPSPPTQWWSDIRAMLSEALLNPPTLILGRAVASLTVPGGQEFHFPHFFQVSINFSYFSSNFTYFLPHFGPPDGRVAHPGRPWLCHWSWGRERIVIKAKTSAFYWTMLCPIFNLTGKHGYSCNKLQQGVSTTFSVIVVHSYFQ